MASLESLNVVGPLAVTRAKDAFTITTASRGRMSFIALGNEHNFLCPRSSTTRFSNGNCTNCGMLDEELLKMKNVARIKVKILHKLGLNQRPILPEVPKQVPSIYGKIADVKDPTENSVAEIADIFSFSEAPENFTDSTIQFTMAGHDRKRKWK
ncbi:hypothetical protein ScPMuIL_015370 [Solemya velum]